MREARERPWQRLVVCVATQTLHAYRDGKEVKRYPVSTAARGPGQAVGSEQTPLGRHRIRLKIGADAPAGAVFVGRRPTGEIWNPELDARHPERDWILTRILWLSGAEPGHNRYGDVDTLRRFIYIHGTPDHLPLGAANSHGCVRMRNDDIIELFEHVSNGTPVDICMRHTT